MNSQPDFETYAVTHTRPGEVSGWRVFLLESYLPDYSNILDVGCGDGRYLEYLSKKVPKDNLTGAEISMIRVNRVRAKGFHCEKVQDTELPFTDNSFDAILFFEVIEHISADRIEGLLQEFVRVLRDGGMVIGSTPNYPAKRVYNYINYTKIGLDYWINKAVNAMFKHPTVPKQFQETDSTVTIQGEKKSFKQRLRRLYADDPTHQFHCNFSIIQNLGQAFFHDVKLFTTFTNQARPVEPNNMLRHLSHKIGFVWSNPKKRQ